MKEAYLKPLVVVTVLGIWQLLSFLGIWNPLLFPDPLRTVIYAVENFDFVLVSVGHSLKLLLVALAVSSGISLIVCSLAALSKGFRTVLDTLSSMLSPVPGISLLPFALMWFGIGYKPILFITVVGSLAVYVLPIMNGFNTIPRIYVDVGRNYSLETWKLIKHIHLPATLPSVLTGVKAAWGLSWRSLIAAELVYGAMGRSSGIGWLISSNRYHLNPNGMAAGLSAIVIIGLVMEHLVMGSIERRTVKKWGMTA